MVRYVGLDVHKVWTQVARHLPDGSIQRERIGTSPALLKQFAETLGPQDVVALESTTNAMPIARLLERRAGRVLISNPMKTHLIAKSHVKTDKVDADVLAQLARSGFLPTVWQPPHDVELLRRRSAYHQVLGQQITRVKNRLHAVLARHLVEPPVRELFCEKGRAFLRRAPVPEDEKLQIELDLQILETLEAAREVAHKELARLAHAHPQAQLLMTIPGINYTTAVGILGAIGEIGRFHAPEKLVSYFGLNPIVHQSAEHCYTGRISKRGRCMARWLLVEAAHCAVRSAGPLRGYFLRLKRAKGTNVAIVAAARKLTVVVWHMLTAGEPYRWAPERTTREKLSLMHYHATGVKRQGGVAKGTPRSDSYGTGVRSRSVRAARDKERLARAQKDYERLVKERKEKPRRPETT
jgi:transposase